ncbi:MAG: 4-hydroxy-tetrahydrodipicolinate synthase [Proteobacteria bacterium]|nr:4-hydroxy-tetrahydrodipicolinate synthase [Pseudomonadota bacterium]MBI3498376.1 4-hydroxy-tetrahydrodipicolinate synthase [Pseudomonadota bacterium]
MARLQGVWLPIITPFADGAIDFPSYERLIDHYIAAGISGIIPLGTTGESPTLGDEEADALIAATVAAVAGRVPIWVGVGGNVTAKVVKAVKRVRRHAIDGILSVCPYYNRPSQEGLRLHFTSIAEAFDRPILIYNIPYRTGVNLANDTLLRLAELANVVGVKDSSGNIAQSIELLRQRPQEFSVLTGEDAYFFTMLAHGGDGGILASAHLMTERFLGVFRRMTANDHQGARAVWSGLEAFVPLLFKEPNPMPIKYCLWRLGLIRSPEGRLPLAPIGEPLKSELDRHLFAGAAKAAE